MKPLFSKQQSRESSNSTIRRIAHFLASRTMFAILISAGFIASILLIYLQAFRPLKVEAGLPAGIPDEITRLHVESAQKIGQFRTERTAHTVRNYSRLRLLFIPNESISGQSGQ